MDFCECIRTRVVEENIKATLVEETIQAQLVEENIHAQIVEETIEAKIVEETIDARIVEEEIRVSIECWPGGGTGGEGTPGQLFVVDVTGAGIISDIQYASGTVPADAVVTEATTDNDSVTIHFMAEGGLNYSPTVLVDGIECTNIQQYPNDRRLFYGSVVVNVPETRVIFLSSSAGSTTSVLIKRGENGPVILGINFTGDYPENSYSGGTIIILQTEVKEHDSFDVEVHFDPTGSEPSSIQIHDAGACKAHLFSTAGTGLDWGNVHTATITVEIDHTSLAVQALPVTAHAVNSVGTAGDPVTSNSGGGTTDGQHTVFCNDIQPSFGGDSIVYPLGQYALKNTEEAQQSTQINNFTFCEYTSPNGDLTITDPHNYDTTKTVTCTHPGSYNDSINNFRIQAWRVENGTASIFSKVIEIADVAPLVTITQPVARLRSSPTGAAYLIRATSNQNLANTPAFSVAIPVSGTWETNDWNGGMKIKTRHIIIEDDDAKGSAPWQWVSGSVPTNRAGIPANITGDEVVGGFLARTLTIDAWANREVEIGTEVVDTTKLVCENLSKGGSAPHGGTYFTYRADTDNNLNQYTILNNDTWYNCDQPNAVSNTSGTAQIILSESV